MHLLLNKYYTKAIVVQRVTIRGGYVDRTAKERELKRVHYVRHKFQKMLFTPKNKQL